MNILVFTNDTASRKWRFDGIADRFHAYTQHEMYITSWRDWNGDTLGADLVIIELLTNEAMVKACQKQGAKVIFEADDAFIDTYGKDGRKNLTHITDVHREESIRTIDACDAITVTNQVLAENFKRFTKKPIYVLPNYIDLNWYGSDKLNIIRNTDEVRIGWFGSRGHFEDLKMVLPALKNVLEKYDNAKLIYCGYGGMSSSKSSTEVGYGEDVFRDIPRERREFVLPVSENLWPIKHATLDLDIGLAPLIDDYFNKCKTPIKYFEYSILNTPSICSDTLYEDYVKHGETGLIAKNVEDWETYLSDLIESKDLRTSIGKAAHADVLENWDLDQHWEDFEKVYLKVLN